MIPVSAVASGLAFLGDFLGLALRFLGVLGWGAVGDTDGAGGLVLGRAFTGRDGVTSGEDAFSAMVGALGAVTRLGLTSFTVVASGMFFSGSGDSGVAVFLAVDFLWATLEPSVTWTACGLSLRIRAGFFMGDVALSTWTGREGRTGYGRYGVIGPL